MLDHRTIRFELEKILASRIFANSPRMSRFLTFVVEETLAGTGGRIKEYVIALEVFDKPPDYDPRADSTVRTEATKLRARLNRYYETEGAADPVIISIPKGSYVAVFQAGSETRGGLPQQSPLDRRWRWILAGIVLLASAAGISFVGARRSVPPLNLKPVPLTLPIPLRSSSPVFLRERKPGGVRLERRGPEQLRYLRQADRHR